MDTALNGSQTNLALNSPLALHSIFNAYCDVDSEDGASMSEAAYLDFVECCPGLLSEPFTEELAQSTFTTFAEGEPTISFEQFVNALYQVAHYRYPALAIIHFSYAKLLAMHVFKVPLRARAIPAHNSAADDEALAAADAARQQAEDDARAQAEQARERAEAEARYLAAQQAAAAMERERADDAAREERAAAAAHAEAEAAAARLAAEQARASDHARQLAVASQARDAAEAEARAVAQRLAQVDAARTGAEKRAADAAGAIAAANAEHKRLLSEQAQAHAAELERATAVAAQLRREAAEARRTRPTEWAASFVPLSAAATPGCGLGWLLTLAALLVAAVALPMLTLQWDEGALRPQLLVGGVLRSQGRHPRLAAYARLDGGSGCLHLGRINTTWCLPPAWLPPPVAVEPVPQQSLVAAPALEVEELHLVLLPLPEAAPTAPLEECTVCGIEFAAY